MLFHKIKLANKIQENQKIKANKVRRKIKTIIQIQNKKM